MDDFGLPEFIELTGVGAGQYGIYLIGPTGVSLPASVDLATYTPHQQLEIYQAVRRLTLDFPCTPANFLKWYDATRGMPPPESQTQPPGRGVSDFPLARGFTEQVRQREGTSDGARPSVPSQKIMSAFQVRGPEDVGWWNRRLRDPGRYGLKSARAAPGAAKRPSRWYPDVVAAWLIEGGHMDRDDVVRAVRRSFPDIDPDLL